MTTKFSYIYSLDQVHFIAKLLVDQLPKYKIFTFTGTLGAGKTTLIKAFLEKAGIQEIVQSPTFTYVNIYQNNKNQIFYHFDLYRIRSLEDFCTAGFEEYLYNPNSWTLIEWPEIIMPLLNNSTAHIAIDYEGFDKRKVTLSCY